MNNPNIIFSSSFKQNGLSKREVILKNKIIYKKIKMNQKQKKLILYLQDKNFFYLPKIKIYDLYISYHLIAGYTFEKIGFTTENNLKEILLIIKDLQKQKYNNKYIVHGDLSPVNIIFNQDLKIIKVIDGDNIKLGSRYEDPAYVFGLWINFGSKEKSIKQIKTEALIFKNIMNYNLKDLKQIKKYICKLIKRERKKHYSDKELLKGYKFRLNWIKNEGKKIGI